MSADDTPAEAALRAEVRDRWTVARTTLGAERMMIGSMNVAHHVADVIAVARTSGRSGDAVVRQDLVDLYVRAACPVTPGRPEPGRGGPWLPATRRTGT